MARTYGYSQMENKYMISEAEENGKRDKQEI